ncbi:uncharacterized protein LOC123319779 [Coccinella septempunctata]|uniref:uncharacterized protein LOC123319779 n=1 Tax=Coccinella septempunctata TaxID=41139 RepID=UPI001D0613E3|nr:uncharacterized protein LOC123319779 [Coccinella septempunctata]
MFPVKVLFVFAAIVVQLWAGDDVRAKDLAIFRECAEANGLGLKKGDHKREDKPSVEMMCTIKCSMEKKGMLSGGKIQIEETKKDLISHKFDQDKIDKILDCMKGIEVSECSDVEKFKDCTDLDEKMHY